MSTGQSPPDPSRGTIVSRSPGLAYERMRDARRSHFAQSVVRKLRIQGALLAALAAAFALLVGGGAAIGGPTLDLVVLGAAGGSLVAASVTAHALVGAYRLRREPLTEREALVCLAVEDGASYLGMGSGSLLVAATVVVAGVQVVTAPAGTTDGTVMVAAGVALGTGVVAALALAAGRHLRGRLPRS